MVHISSFFQLLEPKKIFVLKSLIVLFFAILNCVSRLLLCSILVSPIFHFFYRWKKITLKKKLENLLFFCFFVFLFFFLFISIVCFFFFESSILFTWLFFLKLPFSLFFSWSPFFCPLKICFFHVLVPLSQFFYNSLFSNPLFFVPSLHLHLLFIYSFFLSSVSPFFLFSPFFFLSHFSSAPFCPSLVSWSRFSSFPIFFVSFLTHLFCYWSHLSLLPSHFVFVIFLLFRYLSTKYVISFVFPQNISFRLSFFFGTTKRSESRKVGKHFVFQLFLKTNSVFSWSISSVVFLGNKNSPCSNFHFYLPPSYPYVSRFFFSICWLSFHVSSPCMYPLMFPLYVHTSSLLLYFFVAQHLFFSKNIFSLPLKFFCKTFIHVSFWYPFSLPFFISFCKTPSVFLLLLGFVFFFFSPVPIL